MLSVELRMVMPLKRLGVLLCCELVQSFRKLHIAQGAEAPLLKCVCKRELCERAPLQKRHLYFRSISEEPLQKRHLHFRSISEASQETARRREQLRWIARWIAPPGLFRTRPPALPRASTTRRRRAVPTEVEPSPTHKGCPVEARPKGCLWRARWLQGARR